MTRASTAPPLGKFKVIEPIGGGRSPNLFRAARAGDGSQFALKVFHLVDPGDRGLVDRFNDLAARLVQVRHPHVLRVLGCGAERNFLFLGMELTGGESLEARMERQPTMPWPEVTTVMLSMTLALQACWKHRILHQDLKPENVFITAGGQVKVSFDVIVSPMQDTTLKLGHGRTRFDSLFYISPETALGAEDVDVRGDLYSLGAIAYALLTGDPPHYSKDLAEVIARNSSEEPRPIAEVVPGIPEKLGKILRKLLARSPARRIQGPKKLAAVLRKLRVDHGLPISPLVLGSSEEVKEFGARTWDELELARQAEEPGAARRTGRAVLAPPAGDGGLTDLLDDEEDADVDEEEEETPARYSMDTGTMELKLSQIADRPNISMEVMYSQDTGTFVVKGEEARAMAEAARMLARGIEKSPRRPGASRTSSSSISPRTMLGIVAVIALAAGAWFAFGPRLGGRRGSEGTGVSGEGPAATAPLEGFLGRIKWGFQLRRILDGTRELVPSENLRLVVGKTYKFELHKFGYRSALITCPFDPAVGPSEFIPEPEPALVRDYSRGKETFAARKYEDARKFLTRVVQVDPGFMDAAKLLRKAKARAVVLKAEALIAGGRYEEAEEALGRADPDDPDVPRLLEKIREITRNRRLGQQMNRAVSASQVLIGAGRYLEALRQTDAAGQAFKGTEFEARFKLVREGFARQVAKLQGEAIERARGLLREDKHPEARKLLEGLIRDGTESFREVARSLLKDMRGKKDLDRAARLIEEKKFAEAGRLLDALLASRRLAPVWDRVKTLRHRVRLLAGGMILVPGGVFLLGHGDDARALHGPSRKVTVKAFYIDRDEVSVARYARFVEWQRKAGEKERHQFCHEDEPKNKRHMPLFWWSQLRHPRRPVVYVDWFDAHAFARWSQMRLPTEEEWEKAASWDPSSKAKRVYPWGDEAGEKQGNFKGYWSSDGLAGLVDVTFEKGKSAYGLRCMAGNVMEWTASEFNPYEGSKAWHPQLGKKGVVVLRGGNFRSEPEACRTFVRHTSSRLDRSTRTGFRCAAGAPAAKGTRKKKEEEEGEEKPDEGDDEKKSGKKGKKAKARKTDSDDEE